MATALREKSKDDDVMAVCFPTGIAGQQRQDIPTGQPRLIQARAITETGRVSQGKG